MPLTDAAVKAAKPGEKPYKRTDAEGLYLLITPAGGRWWRFRYRLDGREKLISLGTYPGVPLKLARERAREARNLLAQGIDPSAHRQAARAARVHTLKAIAETWLELQAKKLTPASLGRIRDRLRTWIYPHLGGEPIGSIKPADLLACLRRIEARGRHETAHRARADCGRLFRYAVASGLAEHDPTAALKDALAPIKVRHFAALTKPAEVGALLRAIDGYRGQPVTELALRLAPYLFVRPGELRHAEWSEFHLAGPHPEWRIPAARMKMGREHIVPLARQAVELLRELEVHSGGGRLLFPTIQDPKRPMSENTLNAALRRLGYSSEQMTAHGFRSMASTLLNESGVHPDLIELQLAHRPDNVRAIYNRSERLAERRRMMQDYADLLDRLKAQRA